MFPGRLQAPNPIDLSRGTWKPRIAPFDTADYLDNEETIAAYLTAALEDDNPDMFLVAINLKNAVE
jgi:DNA-binding phage protein